MKKITLVSLAAIVGIASIGCSTTSNTNVKTTNANTAVVVNSNSNLSMNTNMGMNSNATSSNKSITREEYEKDKDRYAKEAKEAGSTIGSGIEDGWIWTKTRTALLATNDLRESTINVDVSNNVITLRGTVASDAQKKKAEEVAKGIEGQKGIKNELKVQAGDSVTNQMTGSNTAGDKKGTANANK